MSDAVNLNAKRAARDGDNRLLSPVDTLKDALADIASGKISPSSILVIHLDRGESELEYNIGWFASNLRSSDMIALMQATQSRLLADMGF